jgi:hypothetical protein
MKGATVIANSSEFYRSVMELLPEIGYTFKVADNCIQISDVQQRLFTLYCDEEDNIIDELESVISSIRERGFRFFFPVDCRWEDLFCSVLKRLSVCGLGGFLIVDNASCIWDPEQLDPTLIRL